MVFESVLKEKPPEYNIGPGDYDLNQTDIKTQLSNSINLHHNRPPFNQSSIRGSKEKLNDYYILKDEQLNLENPINLYEKKTFNTYLNDKTTKNISFLSGQDRFHYKNVEKETLEDLKLLEDGSLTTDYSIPYDIEKKMKKKYTKSERIYNKIGTNPESEKIKEDYIKEKNKKKIGPGEYNINPKWNKNIVKWSGLTEIRLKTDNKESTKPKEIDKEKEQLNINLQHKIKNMKTDLFRSIQHKRKENYNDLIEERRKLILKNEDDDPYIKPGLFDKNPQKNNNQRYQYFGSTSLRKNFNEISTTNENIGPGYYNYNYNYISNRSLTGPKNKKKKNDRKIIYKTRPGIYGLVIGNNENFCDNEDKKKINFEDLYELEKDFKFGTQEVRFRNKRDNEITVGPGEYYHEENWIKNKKNNNSNYNFIHMSKSNKNNDINKDKHNINQNDNFFKNQECSPGVGTYEITKSIEKDHQKFENKYKNNKIPFSSNEQRFFYDNLNRKNQILENNTFEFYLPKEKKIIGGLINPIGINKKINSQLFENGANGPGQYMLDSFFDWNKKTYNIKYT